MKKVAVLGGGPAGAFAAEQLAAAGIETTVFDEKLAWEKPCGGGLTYKAYHQYPFLIENNTPKKLITETVLAAPNAGAVNLRLREPLLIYSRFDLNRMLLVNEGLKIVCSFTHRQCLFCGPHKVCGKQKSQDILLPLRRV